MKHQGRRAVLLANGVLPDPDYARARLRGDDWLVVANGGTRHAAALGRVPALLIGDADSLADELRAWLREHEVPHLAFPRDKDETDLEIALTHVLERGFREILILGAIGGRMDHTLANLSLLRVAARAEVRIKLLAGRERLFPVTRTIEVEGQPGDLVSLLPWGGDALGVTTEGLRWPLADATLRFGTTRGVSNEMHDNHARVTLRDGLLLVTHLAREDA